MIGDKSTTCSKLKCMSYIYIQSFSRRSYPVLSYQLCFSFCVSLSLALLPDLQSDICIQFQRIYMEPFMFCKKLGSQLENKIIFLIISLFLIPYQPSLELKIKHQPKFFITFSKHPLRSSYFTRQMQSILLISHGNGFDWSNSIFIISLLYSSLFYPD